VHYFGIPEHKPFLPTGGELTLAAFDLLQYSWKHNIPTGLTPEHFQSFELVSTITASSRASETHWREDFVVLEQLGCIGHYHHMSVCAGLNSAYLSTDSACLTEKHLAAHTLTANGLPRTTNFPPPIHYGKSGVVKGGVMKGSYCWTKVVDLRRRRKR
jgi:hypothetical protein